MASSAFKDGMTLLFKNFLLQNILERFPSFLPKTKPGSLKKRSVF
jgi:hypothetical protein